MLGRIVDASSIAAPRQRNAHDEKIKEGRVPGDWKDRPAKLRQKISRRRFTSDKIWRGNRSKPLNPADRARL